MTESEVSCTNVCTCTCMFFKVIFREGQLLSGVLDKSQFGASQFGFVHSCYEVFNNYLS